MELFKPPGVAETIDWSMALSSLGMTQLDERTVMSTLGTVLKYREDVEKVRRIDGGVAGLVRNAVLRSA